MTSRRLAHYLRSRKTKKQDESTEMTISSETTYSSSALFQLHPSDDLPEVPPQPASETTSLSFQQQQQHHQHHHHPSLSLSPWKYHETVLEQAEARQVERKCRWQQTNILLESLRDEIGSGVAETVLAERFGQKITDLHATMGAAIRPNENGTIVVVEECPDDDYSDDDEDLITETIIVWDHEESESFSDSNGDASSSPIHFHGGPNNVVESQPPVTYISVPNNNNNTRQGPVHLLYQQQMGMSDCLLVTENNKQDITTFSELKRSLELIDDFGQVERFYQNVMEQEVSVQLAWDQYCRMAESVLPAAATNETAEKSIGDVWLAELRYHQAVKIANDAYEMFCNILTDVLQQHMTRRANVWKTVEQIVVRRPTLMFGKMEALNPLMPVQVQPPTDVDETVVNARLRQIADFHGTTTVIVPDYDRLLSKISNQRIIDVDSFMGRSFDTIDDEEVPSYIDSNRCDWTDILPHSSPRQQEPAIVLDKTSKEYSNFIDQLLFSTSLLESHFCKFTAVVGSLSGKEQVPSQASLLVVTCDCYIHIFNLGDAISMQDTPEMAIRYLSRPNQNTNHELLTAETTLPISSVHIRLLTHLCGVKITNKSSTSRRGYKFILPNETARQMLVKLCDKKESVMTASPNTIRAII